MLIRVNALDIENGEPLNPHNCPVARAVKRATRRKRVTAGVGHICVGGQEIRTPPEVRQFIDQFDGFRGAEACEPFEFDLPLERPQSEERVCL